MNTCFIQDKSDMELVMLFPLAIHLPLVTYFSCYSVYMIYGKRHLKVLLAHVYVVLLFSVSWGPISILHGFNH